MHPLHDPEANKGSSQSAIAARPSPQTSRHDEPEEAGKTARISDRRALGEKRARDDDRGYINSGCGGYCDLWASCPGV